MSKEIPKDNTKAGRNCGAAAIIVAWLDLNESAKGSVL
jgi:hypothetical protein